MVFGAVLDPTDVGIILETPHSNGVQQKRVAHTSQSKRFYRVFNYVELCSLTVGKHLWLLVV